jgi:hypothetical protein
VHDVLGYARPAGGTSRFVLGVEGDWQWSNLTGNSQVLAPLGANGVLPGGPFTISTTTKDYGSIRGRLGVALDRILAAGRREILRLPLPLPARLHSLLPAANPTGGGAGIEYAITKRF